MKFKESIGFTLNVNVAEVRKVGITGKRKVLLQLASV
jgi:hypothetical protein